MVWPSKGNYIMILINHNKTNLLLTQKIISIRDTSVKLWLFIFLNFNFFFCILFLGHIWISICLVCSRATSKDKSVITCWQSWNWLLLLCKITGLGDDLLNWCVQFFLFSANTLCRFPLLTSRSFLSQHTLSNSASQLFSNLSSCLSPGNLYNFSLRSRLNSFTFVSPK